MITRYIYSVDDHNMVALIGKEIKSREETCFVPSRPIGFQIKTFIYPQLVFNCNLSLHHTKPFANAKGFFMYMCIHAVSFTPYGGKK